MRAQFRHPLLAAALGIAFGLMAPAEACTTFCLRDDGRILFGKNYDWNVGDGLLVVNQRGMARMADMPGDKPASWVSRYGSVTFNQYGRDFPAGGMNEAGLVIELKPGAAPQANNSLVRFALAAERVTKFEGGKGDAVAYAFETLDQAAQGNYTQWSIVYEIDRARIHFRTCAVISPGPSSTTSSGATATRSASASSTSISRPCAARPRRARGSTPR